MVVDAVLKLEEDLALDLIGVKQESGGALEVRKLLILEPFPMKFDFCCRIPS
jgi:hypothetical protein